MFAKTQTQMKINWLNHMTTKKKISTYEKTNNLNVKLTVTITHRNAESSTRNTAQYVFL